MTMNDLEHIDQMVSILSTVHACHTLINFKKSAAIKENYIFIVPSRFNERMHSRQCWPLIFIGDANRSYQDYSI